MARTDNLSNYLTDVANAIREKTGSTEPISASNFDEAIRNISGGGSGGDSPIFYTASTVEARDKLQAKDGDVCVVQTIKTAPVENGEITSSSLIILKEVTLPSVITGYPYEECYISSMSSYVNINVSLESSTRCSVRINTDEVSQNLTYTSTDGQTYICNSLEEDLIVNIPSDCYCDVWSMGGEPVSNYFILGKSVSSEGIYSYSNGKWSNFAFGLTENGDNILVGNKALTDLGIVEGVFGGEEPTYEQRQKILEFTYNAFKSPCNFNSLFYDFAGAKLPIDLRFIGTNTNANGSAEVMFGHCHNLEEIDFTGLDFKGTTNLTYFLNNCTSLKRADFSNVKNVDDIERLYSTFYTCSSLEEVKFFEHHYTHAMNIYSMFSYCANLKRVDLSKLVIDNITSMGYMFSGCHSLEFADIRGLNITEANIKDSGKNLFSAQATNCVVVVRDEEIKQRIKTSNATYGFTTNIYTADEWDSMQG